MDDHEHSSEDHSSDTHEGHQREEEPRVEQSMLEEEAEDADEAERELRERTGHDGSRGHGGHDGHEDGHGDHGGMHEGHEQMFRRRFFVSTLLSIPVLLYSETLQEWLGFSAPAFPGSEWLNPVFAVIVFAYGGVPFLKMAVPELRDRTPGMMTLISLAITVAFGYSLAAVRFDIGESFFGELVTLVVIFLLGHWIEMRSVRRASGALDELADLVPATAERVTEAGDLEEVPVDDLSAGDLVLVRPGANVPADGVV